MYTYGSFVRAAVLLLGEVDVVEDILAVARNVRFVLLPPRFGKSCNLKNFQQYNSHRSETIIDSPKIIARTVRFDRFSTFQYFSVLFSTFQYFSVLFSTFQYYSVLFSTFSTFSPIQFFCHIPSGHFSCSVLISRSKILSSDVF